MMLILKQIGLAAFVAVLLCDLVQSQVDYFGFVFHAESTETLLSIYHIMFKGKAGSKKTANTHYPVKYIQRIYCNIGFTEQTDLVKAKQELDTCISNAGKIVAAKSKHHHIWMKFIGTGNLRTLRKSNKKKSDELLDGIKKYLKNKKPVNPKRTNLVEIIEDDAETEYYYISSVYVEGTDTVEEKGTVDIQASSLQVAIPITTNSRFPRFIKKLNTKLFEKDYHFGYLKFKCGGHDNMRYYYLSQLIKDSNDLSGPIFSPCHPAQFSHKIKTDQFLNECTKSLLKNLALPNEITINGHNNNVVCTQKLMEGFCSDDDAKRENKCIIEDPSRLPISVSEKIKINLQGSWVRFSSELTEVDYQKLVPKMTDMFDRNDCFNNNKDLCFYIKYLIFITYKFVKSTDEATVTTTIPSVSFGKMLLDTIFLVPKPSKAVIIIVLFVVLLFIAAGLAFFWCFYFKRRIPAPRR